MEDHDPDGGHRLSSRRSCGDKVLPYTTEMGITLLWLAAALTMYTGYDYFKAGLKHIVDEE